MLLLYLQGQTQMDSLFISISQLLENILQRSTYLALLTENPSAIKHLIRLFSLSPWITEEVSEHPFLLEVLLDEDNLYQPFTEEQLQQQLLNNLVDSYEIEHQVEQLKHFKLMQQLRVAAAFVTDLIPAYKAAMHLSRTASVIIRYVLALAKQSLTEKYPDIETVLENFAIIAYGKLGSGELSIQSDLDLVFLHSATVDQEIHIIRLSRKILHILNTRTIGGILYTVDTRLRPSGSAGLLVSHIDTFQHYQFEKAWTWEHQALVKARFLAGSDELGQRFFEIRQETLSKTREISSLVTEISDMRCKMKAEHSKESDQVIKQQDYGLIDVEFTAQFMVLAFSEVHPQMSAYHSVYKIFQAAYQIKLITATQLEQLVAYYDALQQQLSQALLCGEMESPKDMNSVEQLMQDYGLAFCGAES